MFCKTWKGLCRAAAAELQALVQVNECGFCGGAEALCFQSEIRIRHLSCESEVYVNNLCF